MCRNKNRHNSSLTDRLRPGSLPYPPKTRLTTLALSLHFISFPSCIVFESRTSDDHRAAIAVLSSSFPPIYVFTGVFHMDERHTPGTATTSLSHGWHIVAAFDVEGVEWIWIWIWSTWRDCEGANVYGSFGAVKSYVWTDNPRDWVRSEWIELR